jgi:histidinol-phosphate/aromatic aminotransferase/cobyric acid decarboxylase-like protein
VIAHGGLHDLELAGLGLRPDEVLDFSVNLNFYGPCPTVAAAVRAAPLAPYPDPTGHAARSALAAALGLDSAGLVLGNGAADLLWTLARTVPADRAALIVEPTFSELRSALGSLGNRVVEWRARAEHGFAVDLEAVSRRVREERPAALYLCSPNNPTGVALPAADIDTFARTHESVTIVLDQAFLSLSERFADASHRFPDNVVCVRSLTKDHALAGVRVAYLVTSPARARALEAQRPPWTTSAFAQAAVIAAATASRFVDRSRERLFADRDRLAAGLRALGLAPLPTATTFCLVPVPDGGRLRRTLLERHRILVRDCASFGLPGFIRLAARPEPDCARLLAALGDGSNFSTFASNPPETRDSLCKS